MYKVNEIQHSYEAYDIVSFEETDRTFPYIEVTKINSGEKKKMINVLRKHMSDLLPVTERKVKRSCEDE